MRNTQGTITIRIAPDGTPEISVEGIKGGGCKAATAEIEAAYGGEVTSDTPTTEMYERGGEDVYDRNRA